MAIGTCNWFAGGDELYRGRNVVKRLTLDLTAVEGLTTHDTLPSTPTEVVVKCFPCRNLWQRVAYSWFSNSKAHKAYDNACRLEAAGIGTPHAYGYVERRDHGLLRECYLLTDIDHGTDLAHFLPVHGTEPYDTAVAEAFGAFVARLHRAGIVHHDLNSTNVRCHVRADGQGYDFSLIDINRMAFCDTATQPLSLSVRLENLTRFTGRQDITAAVAHAYALASGEEADTFVALATRQKARHDRRWRLRKRLTHPFRNLN